MSIAEYFKLHLQSQHNTSDVHTDFGYLILKLAYPCTSSNHIEMTLQCHYSTWTVM